MFEPKVKPEGLVIWVFIERWGQIENMFWDFLTFNCGIAIVNLDCSNALSPVSLLLTSHRKHQCNIIWKPKIQAGIVNLYYMNLSKSSRFYSSTSKPQLPIKSYCIESSQNTTDLQHRNEWKPILWLKIILHFFYAIYFCINFWVWRLSWLPRTPW